LISEENEKENYSINSNKISDYNSVSGYSASNFSSQNELNSNLNSFAKSEFIHENNLIMCCSSKNSKITEHNLRNKQSLYVSDFSGNSEKNIKRKLAKKTFTLLKNLIYIPIVSISGEVRNSFTLKKIILGTTTDLREDVQVRFEAEAAVAALDNIFINEVSIRTPYFDNLYTFFLNYLENCRYEKHNKDSNNSSSNNNSNNDNFNHLNNKSNSKFPFTFKYKKEQEDESFNNIQEILLKETARLENLELSRIKERLELYFKIMKKFSILETKANLNPNKNSFYISFLNIIRMADIQILIQKLNFPNQEKFFSIIKSHNLYLEEIKLNAKKDQIKLVIAQFQKSNNHNSKNFQNKIAYLLQIISFISEALVNKQIQVNKIKKLIYEKENKLLSQSESHNLQIFLKFNIEQNCISQIGFLKERNSCSFEFNFLLSEADRKENKDAAAAKINKGFEDSKLYKNHNNRKIRSKSDYKNFKLKKEIFVFDFYKSEEQYLQSLKRSEEGFGHGKEVLKAKSEFELMLIVRERMKILREYEIA